MLNKTRIAALLQRFPILARLLVLTYRLTRSRYTAGVNGVLLNAEGKILLVKHVYHPKHPWGLPGGWVDRMEEPADTVVREFREEMGLEIVIVRPILIQKGQFWGSHLDMAFWVKVGSENAPIRLSPELLAYDWFAADALPPLKHFDRRVIESALAQQIMVG
jgi:ADP-ribose pyrophosphatase YjhB (NUDIX family)